MKGKEFFKVCFYGKDRLILRMCGCADVRMCGCVDVWMCGFGDVRIAKRRYNS